MTVTCFVEIIHRGREVRHRYRLDHLPIRIGRAYDNDVILDDPHTAAHHAVVEEDDAGGLRIRELESRNGIVLRGRRVPQAAVDGNAVYRLGHTHLRVRTAGFRVADELADVTRHGWEGWPPALAGLALLVVVAVMSSWLGDATRSDATRYLGAVATALGLGMFWCGGWAFANRLFGGATRLGRHLFILGCGVAAQELLGWICTVLAFSLSWEPFTRYGNHLVVAGFAIMIWFHLLQIKPYNARRFTVACALMAAVGSGAVLLANYRGNGRLADELYMHERLPPSMRLSANRPLSRLMGNVAGLKAAVDAERTKTVNGDSDEEGNEDEE